MLVWHWFCGIFFMCDKSFNLAFLFELPVSTFKKLKWNEWGFKPPLCTCRLNWARRTSWEWWDEWEDTAFQTHNSKFEPWCSGIKLQMNESPKHFTNKTCYDFEVFLFAILFYCLIKSVPGGDIASPVLISACTMKKIAYTSPKPLLEISGRDIFSLQVYLECNN